MIAPAWLHIMAAAGSLAVITMAVLLIRYPEPIRDSPRGYAVIILILGIVSLVYNLIYFV